MELQTLFKRESAARSYSIRIYYMSSYPYNAQWRLLCSIHIAYLGGLEDRFKKSRRLKNGGVRRQEKNMSSTKQWFTLFSSANPASEYNHKVSYHPVIPKTSYSHVIVAYCIFHVNLSPRYPSTPSNHPMITVHLKVPYMFHLSNCPPIRVYDAVHTIDTSYLSTCKHLRCYPPDRF